MDGWAPGNTSTLCSRLFKVKKFAKEFQNKLLTKFNFFLQIKKIKNIKINNKLKKDLQGRLLLAMRIVKLQRNELLGIYYKSVEAVYRRT